MNKFEVVGYNGYTGVKAVVDASSQKSALTKVLTMKDIGFEKVTKMTRKENQTCLDSGIDPVLMIDFVVTNLDSDNPIVSIGNWHID